MELKRFSYKIDRVERKTFNRTILELKQEGIGLLINNGLTFNRTILELKLAAKAEELYRIATFNRTILELKSATLSLSTLYGLIRPLCSSGKDYLVGLTPSITM